MIASKCSSVFRFVKMDTDFISQKFPTFDNT